MEQLRIRLALKHLRNQHNLTAKELSTRAGLPVYLVSRLESGKTQLDFLTAMKLAAAMCVSLDDIARVGLALPADELAKGAEIAKLRRRLKELGR